MNASSTTPRAARTPAMSLPPPPVTRRPLGGPRQWSASLPILARGLGRWSFSPIEDGRSLGNFILAFLVLLVTFLSVVICHCGIPFFSHLCFSSLLAPDWSVFGIFFLFSFFLFSFRTVILNLRGLLPSSLSLSLLVFRIRDITYIPKRIYTHAQHTHTHPTHSHLTRQSCIEAVEAHETSGG
ncbi:hypothetical protein GGS23DRAFT_394066 [Durotheca rogersii]|uniref:uncharacterized protein n=1 Tax=Durotheca rogersii TaxID=419775 RepID=UPI00221E5A35|nr:uncharacterized protein GGS23DRAFT_394066 [Durotheca rogersii]KAI5856794.1 hypothetical protein GGS23DRAFT_394066 [Durotheca rogersii]